MSDLNENLSRAIVELPANALRRMLKLVRLLDRLSRNPEYRARVYPQVPEQISERDSCRPLLMKFISSQKGVSRSLRGL
jgi:hypothetical protein